MSMEFLVETTDKKVNEISGLVKSVEWEDKLNDGCSKLTFSYLDTDLTIDNGSIVRFKYDGTGIFYGVVFKHEHVTNRVVTVTAYDQLRYCKAKDTVVCKGDSVVTLAKKMCNYFGLRVGMLAATGYTLSTSVQDSKSWLDILYAAIQDTLRYNGKWFALRDEFGSVCLRNLTELESDLILGDGSGCYDFDYSKSIDDNTYNQIKLAVDNEVTGKRNLYMTRDSGSISKFGLLQYFDVMSFSTTSTSSSDSSTSDSSSASTSTDKTANEAKKKALAIQMANALLSLYNGETETLTMDCIGDTSIRAGNSFHTYISEIGINKRLIVKTATHTFLPSYTMKLEVQI